MTLHALTRTLARSVGWPSLALILIASLALAACGNDSNGDDPVDTPTPTPQEEEPVNQERQTQWSNPPEMQLEEGRDYVATLRTNRGDIVIDLFEGETPRTVNNFVFLAEHGFYQNVPFHRVIRGFMIQTGDPTGTGRGGPGYRFDDEPVTRDYIPGKVAMANAGPNTNGSQFFIVHADLRQSLPKNYTIFGQVIEGMDVVDAIASVPVRAGATGEMSSPTEEVYIESIEIEAR